MVGSVSSLVLLTTALPQQSALELLGAAMKYMLLDLRDLVEDFLVKEITVKNVFSILVEAHRLSALKVFRNAVRFVCQRWESFSK
jgi:hypothetical protein